MEAVSKILVLWLVFATTHMLLSSRQFRPRLVGALGERGFLGAYSALSLVIFVPLLLLYFGNRHAGPLLWYLAPFPGVRWLVYVGMGAAFALIVAGNTRPSPASIAGGKPDPSGVLCITRHPLFMGVGLFGLLHLLVVPVNAAELAFFGGFPLFALVGCHHQDRRKLAEGDESFRRFHAATPFLPSATGILPALRIDWRPMAVGVLLALVVRWLHAPLLG